MAVGCERHHTAELVEREGAAELSDALLPDEHRPARSELDDERDQSKPEDVAQYLIAEMHTHDEVPTPAVALRGARRWRPHFAEIKLPKPEQEAEIEPSSVYVVTGALGRIGLSLSEYLAARGATVIATTRRSRDDLVAELEQGSDASDLVEGRPSDWQSRIGALLSQPERFIVEHLNVADREAVGALVNQVALKYGRIDGIFHAAGLAHLKFLSEMDEETLALECESKISGTRNLYGAVADAAVEHGVKPGFVFLFSSLASILGGPAMAAYAAANRFMDTFARDASGSMGVRWINTNWDDWAFSYGGEVTNAYATSEARDLAMTPGEGLDLIRAILEKVHEGQVIVATRPLEARIRQWLGTQHADDLPSKSVSRKPSDLLVSSRGESLDAFLESVSSLLGSSTIRPEDNFFDIGGDSLLATALLMKLRSSKHWRPPLLEEIFKTKSIGALHLKLTVQ